ncbi:MAG: hypothetical protein V7K55_17440 [Nostoc sp.]|uniref:hypothetical protein n=1 Tax=Nostoc sp. TaxID=1180 RepID=UPI002FFCE21E
MKHYSLYLFDTGHFALEEDGKAICISRSQTILLNFSSHGCNPSLSNQSRSHISVFETAFRQ